MKFPDDDAMASHVKFYGTPIVVVGPDEYVFDPESGKLYCGPDVWKNLKRAIGYSEEKDQCSPPTNK